jgi:hypothetical protein
MKKLFGEDFKGFWDENFIQENSLTLIKLRTT